MPIFTILLKTIYYSLVRPPSANIDGNHENFDMLEDYPDDFWNGGRVHFISDNIFHLARGQVFEIDGLTFFTFDGGNSIDKGSRQIGLSW